MPNAADIETPADIIRDAADLLGEAVPAAHELSDSYCGDPITRRLAYALGILDVNGVADESGEMGGLFAARVGRFVFVQTPQGFSTAYAHTSAHGAEIAFPLYFSDDAVPHERFGWAPISA